jgi:hypothetical protein
MMSYTKLAYEYGVKLASREIRDMNQAAADRAGVSVWRPRARHLVTPSLGIAGTMGGGTLGTLAGGVAGAGIGHALDLSDNQTAVAGILGAILGLGLGGYSGYRAGTNVDKALTSYVHGQADKVDSKWV